MAVDPALVRSLPVLMLTILVVLGGCGGTFGTGDSGQPSETVSWSPTPSPTPERTLPPGVSETAVDAATLAEAHHLALARAAVTVETRRLINASNGTTLADVRTTTRSNGSRIAYQYAATGAAPRVAGITPSAFSYWSDGDETLYRSVDSNGTVTYAVLPSEAQAPLDVSTTGRDRVFGALSVMDPRLDGTRSKDGLKLYVLRAEAKRIERPRGSDWQNVSLTATVTEGGVVTMYRLRYETRFNETAVAVEEQFRVQNVTETVVSQPDWYEEAHNRNQTGTGSEANAVGS